jgi:hypothetical protein
VIWKPMLIGFGFWVAVMLTALVAKGQEIDSSTGYNLYGILRPTQVIPPYSSTLELLGFWDKWVDSCWADSTFQLSMLLTCRSLGDTTRPLAVSCWHDTLGVTHRDPNDLKGFMEFLRRRTK